MTKHELCLAMYSPIFGERETVQEAYEYAMSIAEASNNKTAVMVALHVLMNSIAKELERTE